MITINLNFVLLVLLVLIIGASISEHSYVIVTEKIGMLLYANQFLVIIILRLNVVGWFIIWIKNLILFVAIELCYPILSQKMDEISAAAMWKESNVTTNAQRIFARHLSYFFGNRLIVLESCIPKLGQNHVPPKSDSIILNDQTIHFWT